MSPLDRRRFIFVAGSAAVIAQGTSASAQDAVVLNGFWGEEQDSLTRYGYVVGFVDSATHAFDILPAMQQEAKTRQTTELQAVSRANFDFNNIAFGQLVEGMTKFYEDFRNKRIKTQDAMNCVKGEIQGTDPAKLERNVLLLRKWAATDK